MRRARVGLALGAIVVAGCSDNGTGPERGARGLSVKVEGATTDTVTAPAVSVVATLNDSTGHPVRGATVTFRVATLEEEQYLGVAPSGAIGTIYSMTTARTDSSGQARADLIHRSVAGTGRLTVGAAVGAVYVTDTIVVTTAPGHVAGVVGAPRDTALYQGGTAHVTAVAVDRFGNARPERGTINAATSGVSISGNTVTATAGPSRQVVRVQYATYRDSMFVSIVPQGVFAARAPGPFTFTVMRLDGSGPSTVTMQNPGRLAGIEAWTEWTPDGSELLSHATDNQTSDHVTVRMTLSGGWKRVPASSPLGSDVWPQMSADGSWIYFSSFQFSGNGTSIYRVHPNGTGLAQVSLPGMGVTNDILPSPSQDNAKVVYATDREGHALDYPDLEVLDVATSAVTSLGPGTMPRWSPDGQWIAFLRAGVPMLVHPDGTGARQILTDSQGYDGELSWSPDSKWLIARNNASHVFDLLEVATGLRLPLGYSANLFAPDWRPF